MKYYSKLYIVVFCFLFFISKVVTAQLCIKDSNYYSITYHGLDKNEITAATVISLNEVVTLSRHSVFSNFVTKYTSQGSVIWSNEYLPDYPHINWVQYPWYNNTLMEGLAPGLDSTTFIYGSSTEHGRSINNIEEPPTHQVGLFMQLDKFGNVIKGKYFGNWYTDYSVNNLIQLPDGKLVVYLQSHFNTHISKILCINQAGEIIWGAPLETDGNFYRESDSVNPLMKQKTNGNIIVVNEMVRNVEDIIVFSPFFSVLVPPPITYFHILELDGNNGKVIWENSFQSFPLTNTNAPAGFVPEIKNIAELPDGSISFCADMYLPADNEVFYKHSIFKKSAVNFIVDKNGFFLKFIVYFPENSSASLLNAQTTSSTGEQLLLLKDTTNQQLILCKIDPAGQLVWSQAYANNLPTDASSGFGLAKKDGKGYFIFQSEPSSVDFHLSVTNALGQNHCTQLPVTMKSEETVWPWPGNKIHLFNNPLDIDFRYSPFNIKKISHPVTQQTDCQYENACCTDFIDSLHPHAVSICENESYKLPDNTVVKDSGTYYITLKAKSGCDSIIFYTIKVIKSPSHLQGSTDTCLNTAATIQLHATDGYENYWWNNTASSNPYTTVNTPGTYTVSVSNICGEKVDTIMVYDRCEFPVFMPSAFTPNGDFLNDIFRVPSLNKNRFKRLSIFNRWGQLVFSTTDQGVGWDGKTGIILQPVGVYVYWLEMEDLTGKKIDQKGTVALIR